MFFTQNTNVSVTAAANPGFTFRPLGRRLERNLSGSGVVTMAAPRNRCRAVDKVPFVAPAGVQNAASSTPSSKVAPGSIIAIYGESLAPSLEVGPVNPLSAIDQRRLRNRKRHDPASALCVAGANQRSASMGAGGWQLHNGDPFAGAAGRYRYLLCRPQRSRTLHPNRGFQTYAIAFHEDGSL